MSANGQKQHNADDVDDKISAPLTATPSPHSQSDSLQSDAFTEVWTTEKMETFLSKRLQQLEQNRPPGDSVKSFHSLPSSEEASFESDQDWTEDDGEDGEDREDFFDFSQLATWGEKFSRLAQLLDATEIQPHRKPTDQDRLQVVPDSHSPSSSSTSSSSSNNTTTTRTLTDNPPQMTPTSS